jgi:iron complex outermembrane receptor protein
MALLWKPTDWLSITPSFLYQEIQQDGLSLIDSDPGTENQYQPYNSPEPFLDRIDISSLNTQLNFTYFDVTSTTSYWTRDEELRQDGTEGIATVIGTPVYPPNGFGPTSPTSLEDDKSHQTSEEIRFTSVGDTKFKWLGGYFYQDFESDWNLYVPTPAAVPLVGTANGFTQIQPTKIIQNAFFGEVSYEFLPQLTGTVGLRRFDYSGTVNSAVSGWLSSSGGNNVLHFVTSEKDQGVTPKFNLSYAIDKDLLVYTTASKGFRLQGVPSGRRQSTHSDHRRARYGMRAESGGDRRQRRRAAGFRSRHRLEL